MDDSTQIKVVSEILRSFIKLPHKLLNRENINPPYHHLFPR